MLDRPVNRSTAFDTELQVTQDRLVDKLRVDCYKRNLIALSRDQLLKSQVTHNKRKNDHVRLHEKNQDLLNRVSSVNESENVENSTKKRRLSSSLEEIQSETVTNTESETHDLQGLYLDLNSINDLSEEESDSEIVTETENESETQDLQDLYLDLNSAEPQVQVDVNIAKILKPHQKEGVQFMWDTCFESVEKIKNNSPGTCTLQH